MASLQLFNELFNENNNDIFETEQDPIMETSTTTINDNTEQEHTPWHVTLNFDSSLQHATMVTPGTQHE